MIEQGKSPEFQETPKSEFVAKLERLWERGNFVCVGLDSDYDLIPESIKEIKSYKNDGIYDIGHFNCEIVKATHDLVCAYKLNLGFYENNSQAEQALGHTVEFIHRWYPDIPVIGDNKVADIGNTNLGYVSKLFDRYKFDAATVNPYLGKEALAPFLARKDKGIIVLVKTSNSGAGEFQDLRIPLMDLSRDEREFFLNTPGVLPRNEELGAASVALYQLMGHHVSALWNENGNCAIVVGATYPKELAEVRAIVGDMPILIPGIGVQGGEVEATVKAGKDNRGWGMIINSSRGIIFASKGPDFAEAARRETQRLREEINKYR